MGRREVLYHVIIAVLLIGASSEAADSVASKPTEQQERFFENKIRPLLVKHCLECHGAKKQQAELRLDSRAALLKGNESGPAVIPGDPRKSRLMEVLRFSDDDVQMPPNGKLNAGEIATFAAWIKSGAIWPVGGAPTDDVDSGEIDFEKIRKSHWAFQPVVQPSLPVVKNPGWISSPLDSFILAKLEAKGVAASAEADRRTLIRRVTFDLTGLPPTFEDVEAYVNDSAPNAYEKLVDRLLASPRYGERWGRHWLDIARYADSKGYVFTEETRYPYAYTYRDYVIRALNEDLPYDRFVLEQIAADQLPDKDPHSQAALGFLTVGRRFRNSTPDIIDDRIDVVMRGLMGLTAGCARCHDHKFDPLPIDDYYSLYGVFASSYEPPELPLLGKPDETEAYLAYKKELDKRQATHDTARNKDYQKLLTEFRSRVGDYLLQVVKSSGKVNGKFALSFDAGEPRPQVVAAWKTFLTKTPSEYLPVFAPWKAFAALPEKEFEVKAKELVERYKKGEFSKGGKIQINPLVMKPFVEKPPKSMYEVATAYGVLFSDVYAGKTVSPEMAELRDVLYGKGSPTALSLDQVSRLFDRATKNKLRELRKKVEQWKLSSEAAPARAMVLLDSPKPVSPVVFIRGNPARRGKTVPRRFPQILSAADSEFQQGSGRLELARSIVDGKNPLTARVIVNRIWMHHFGNGLAHTPSDFGVRSPLPTHPELLDYLTAQFMRDGWSLKKLHRWIVCSSTYRQVSDDDAVKKKVDPENRLLWRMPRRRLGFEAMRDSLLAASGELDQKMTGRPVDILKSPATGRRTVYGFVNRNNLPSMFRIFDFANPDASTGKRSKTTVPQQALFAMNSPFVSEQAERLAAHADFIDLKDDARKVRLMYHRVLTREPNQDELAMALSFLNKQKDSAGQQDVWAKLAQVLLLTNEFLFID